MEYILSILYYFRQGGKLIKKNSVSMGGNLDPFYLLAPLYIKENYKNKYKMKIVIISFISLVLYLLFQNIFVKDIELVKSLVNIAKIIVCFISMLYVIDNYKKFDFKKVAEIISILYAISIPIAYLFKQSDILWRHNDSINKYTLVRLHLFYLEPSELGFHISIILIILLGFLLVCKTKREQICLILLIFSNLAVLYMARPFGAIVMVTFAILAMLSLDYIYNPSKQKLKIYGLILVVMLIVALYMFINKTPIYMRLLETINGTDSSNNFRVKVSLNVLRESLIDTHGIGVGFGNINTNAFLSKYYSLGLTEVLANSFMYYVIETGIWGGITLIVGIRMLIKSCILSKSIIKWGLLIFLLTYQILGGHFTSGLYWALYGIILSDFHENKAI